MTRESEESWSDELGGIGEVEVSDTGEISDAGK